MKCNNYVKWATRRRKGSGAEYQKAVEVKSRVHFQGEHDKMVADGYVICDGHVTCTKLAAVDEPEWGGSYAKLVVEYTCDKCGNVFYPELGDEAGAKALLQRAIDAIDDDEQQSSRDEWWRLYTMPIEERIRLFKQKTIDRETLAAPSQETDPPPQ